MSAATKTVRIIGIGSPVQGDEAGLQLVERLRQDKLWQSRDEIEWLLLERPGASLLHHFSGVETVCLVDALESAVHKGIVRVDPESLLAATASFSSHHFGVAETLQLASTLKQLPPRLFIYGISSGSFSTLYHELSAMLLQDLLVKDQIKTPATMLSGS